MMKLVVLLTSLALCWSESKFSRCTTNTTACIKENMAYEALKELHAQLDDDKNGDVDPSEADEFFREELHHLNNDNFERPKAIHREDKHLTVDDLWRFWQRSPVYNWTVDDAVEWLVENVELPQYAESFMQFQVDGQTLPILAISNMSYLVNPLRVKNPVHKQKLMLKAMDVVLFGPPKKVGNIAKDMTLVTSVLTALAGCWFAYVQYRYSKRHMQHMSIGLDSLSKAEASLMEMQQRLHEAERTKAKVSEEKQEIEEKYRTEVQHIKQQASRLLENSESAAEERERLRMAEEELDCLRELLAEKERQLEEASAAVAAGGTWGAPNCQPPVQLKLWLQITHEIELQYYNAKKCAAEQQLMLAREACEKIRKKRNTFMGPLRIAHSSNLDDIDKRITEAREALDEVRADLQDRLHRWSQMETLTGFQLQNNVGVSSLRAALRERPHAAAPAATSTPISGAGGGVAAILPSVQSSAAINTTASTTPGPTAPGMHSMVRNKRLSCPALVQLSTSRTSSSHSSDNFLRPFIDHWKSKAASSKRRRMSLTLVGRSATFDLASSTGPITEADEDLDKGSTNSSETLVRPFALHWRNKSEKGYKRSSGSKWITLPPFLTSALHKSHHVKANLDHRFIIGDCCYEM